ncbi:hypothetical protein NP026_23675, partial [Salmonella enterica]|nr:hypothetical protein [Salmonella enterica]
PRVDSLLARKIWFSPGFFLLGLRVLMFSTLTLALHLFNHSIPTKQAQTILNYHRQASSKHKVKIKQR